MRGAFWLAVAFAAVAIFAIENWPGSAAGAAPDGPEFTADGKLVAFGRKNDIQLYDVAAKKVVGTLKGHTVHPDAMAFTPEKLDGKMHKLEVRLKNPSFNIRARRSYLARKTD